MVLLITTTLDINKEILPLIYSYAISESKQAWLDFLLSFRECFIDNIEDISDKVRQELEHLTIISDRGKGLVPAVAEVLLKAYHYHCTQYLAENVGRDHGKKIEKLFREVCLIGKKPKFNIILDQIESILAPARIYID